MNGDCFFCFFKYFFVIVGCKKLGEVYGIILFLILKSKLFNIGSISYIFYSWVYESLSEIDGICQKHEVIENHDIVPDFFFF